MNALLRIASGLVVLGAALLPGPHAHRTNHPSLKRYAVIIVLDGARPDFLNPKTMPNVRWIEQHGVTYGQAFVGQLIANTPPGHATIGTGVFPKHHGIIGFLWKDPRTGLMTRPTDNALVLNGALEAVLKQNNPPSISKSVHSVDPSAKTVAISGHKCYAADAMGGPDTDYILCALIYHDRWVAQAVGSHRPPPGAINNPKYDVPIPNPNSGFAPAVEQWNVGVENDWTMRYALWAFHRVHYPRVMMINLPETDVLGHFSNDNPKVFGVLATRFNTELGDLIAAYKKAGILDETDFIITADHGMATVKKRIPFSIWDDADARAGATKVYLEADMGGELGISQDGLAQSVSAYLARLGGSAIDATLYKVENRGRWSFRVAYARPGLPKRLIQAYVLLSNTTASAAGPNVIGVYAPNVTTGDRPARGYHWLAGHLGPQWPDQHIPLIVAGAGVKHGVVSSYPARLVDVAPTVEQLLGAPVHTDGVVLQDALTSRNSSRERLQQAMGNTLYPVVEALQARDKQ